MKKLIASIVLSIVCLFLNSALALAERKASSPLSIQSNLEESLIQNLKPISKETFGELQKQDPQIFSDRIDPQKILSVQLNDARKIMGTWVKNRWGPMELFAHPFFRYDNRVLYFSQDVLSVINQEFLVTSLFFPRGRVRKDIAYEKGIIAKGTFFELAGLLLGDGRVVALYPFPIAVHRTDAIFGYLTGNYSLFRVNIADIQSEYGQSYILAHFRGRNSPIENWQAIRGPLRAPVEEIILGPKRKEVQLISALSKRSFSSPALEEYQPPLYMRSNKSTDSPTMALEKTKVKSAQ
jgi:hypothetical protein